MDLVKMNKAIKIWARRPEGLNITRKGNDYIILSGVGLIQIDVDSLSQGLKITIISLCGNFPRDGEILTTDRGKKLDSMDTFMEMIKKAERGQVLEHTGLVHIENGKDLIILNSPKFKDYTYINRDFIFIKDTKTVEFTQADSNFGQIVYKKDQLIAMVLPIRVSDEVKYLKER